MYLLADLNDIFFKIDSAFEISPLFDQAASADGYTQENFLLAFYPSEFLMKVGKKSKEDDPDTTDHGVYYDKARRSKLFNGALPYSRKRSLRCEIIFSITLEEWGYIHKKCEALCEKCSPLAKETLLTFLDQQLEEYKNFLPKTFSLSFIKKIDALDVKLAAVMLLYLFLPLEVTEEEMQDDNLLALGTEIVEQLEGIYKEKTAVEILCYEDGYEYIEFGQFPQTVVTDKEVLRKLQEMENKQYEEMQSLPPTEMANYLRASKKTAEVDGILVDGERYVRKVMCVNSFLDDLPENFVFSNNEQVKAEAYYCKKEPIRWRILEKTETKEGTELFLLSERILFKAAYNEHIRKEHGYVCQSGREYAYSWKASDLRDQLNSEFDDSFIHMAFTEEEKSCIVESITDQSAGWYFQNTTTEDKIFVLSEQEASRYLFAMTEEEYDIKEFRNKYGYEYPRTALRAVGFMTDYALLCGVRPEDLSAYNSYLNCPHYKGLIDWGSAMYTLPKQGRLYESEVPRTAAYWLKSPGDKNAKIQDVDKELDYTRRTATITPGGFVNARGVCVDGGKWDHFKNALAKDGGKIGVRPAMRIVIKDQIHYVDKTNNPWKAGGTLPDFTMDTKLEDDIWA